VTEILAPFTGAHSGLEGLNAAKDALEKALSERGYPFLRAVLPNQTLKNGVVRFELVSFVLSSLQVEGNEHFSSDNITDPLPLAVGESPNTQDLAQVLAMINENPAKSVKLNFAAAEQPNQVKARVKVEDRDPQSIFIQLNNTGSDQDSELRLSIGYQHANLFDADQLLTLTFTTAPEKTNEVRQWGLNYRAPLYGLGGFFELLVSDSTVDSGEVAQGFEIKGSGSVVSMGYNHPFQASGSYNHRLVVTVSQKDFDNDVRVLGNPIGSDVASQPLSVRYQGSWLKPGRQTGFSLDLVSNIVGGNNNDDASYAASRAGARADWSALNYSISHIGRFSGGSLWMLNLRGMQSDDALISGEQFGIGGASSVRGYDERVALGDSGYVASLEYWSRPLGELEVRWTAFADGGSVERNALQPGEIKTTELAGYGLGLRWNYKQSASMKLDLAVANKDHAPSTTQSGDTRLHLNISYRF
jgi:hemolysin activation/secretion protein